MLVKKECQMTPKGGCMAAGKMVDGSLWFLRNLSTSRVESERRKAAKVGLEDDI